MPRIVDPNSPAPAINRTLVSYPRDVLAALARSGDVDALKELIRNPAGIDVNQAVPGWRYLIEPGQTRVYGGPNGASAGLGPNLSDIFKR